MLKTLNSRSQIPNRQIWNIAYSIMLGNLAQTIIAFTDTAFLGRLGEVELGAAAMSGIYYYFFTTLSWGFSMGVQVIVARRLGEGNLGRIVSTFLHGLVFILFFASVLFGVIHFFSPVFLRAVLTSENIYNVSLDFLSYRAYGIFFASINFMYRSFYIGLSKTRSISYSTIIMAAVNILLDWAFIFGTPFNPAMGVKGAALASVMAEVSAAVFFTIYTLRSHPVAGHKVFERFKFEYAQLHAILKLSLPTMLQKMFSYGIWLYFFFMIESIGERELAVTMVLRNIFMMTTIPAFAFAAATNTLTSWLIGQSRQDEVIPTIFKVLRMCLLMSLPLVIVMMVAPAFWVGLIVDSAQMIELAVPICYMVCACTIAMAVGVAFFEAVSGTGYTQAAFYMELAALAVYVAFIWYCVKIVKAPLLHIWASDIFYAFVLLVTSWWFMRYYNWRSKKI